MVVFILIDFQVKMTYLQQNIRGLKQMRPNSIHDRYTITPIYVGGHISDGRPREPRPASESHDSSVFLRGSNHNNQQVISRQQPTEEHPLTRTNSVHEIPPGQLMNGTNPINEIQRKERKHTTTGQKIKQLNKTYQHNSINENRLSLGTNNNQSRVTVLSKNQSNKEEFQSKSQREIKEIKQWTLLQLQKINQKMKENEEKHKILEDNIEIKLKVLISKSEEGQKTLQKQNDQKIKKIEQKIEEMKIQMREKQSSNGFTPQQTQYLNQVLALVQKVGNHEEHKKTQKMIEQLRQNILELHMTINQLSSKKEPTSLTNILKENTMDRQLKDVRVKIEDLSKKMVEHQEITSKFKKIQDYFEELKKGYLNRQSIISKTVSPIITLTLREQGTSSFEGSQPEQKARSAILSESVYYIDSEGFLLDSNKFYLLNEQQEQIRLSQTEIDLLKTHSLM